MRDTELRAVKLTDFDVARIAGLLERSELCKVHTVVDQAGEVKLYLWSAEPETGNTHLQVAAEGTCLIVNSYLFTAVGAITFTSILQELHMIAKRDEGYLMVDNVPNEEYAEVCRGEGLVCVASSKGKTYVEVTQ